MSGQEVQVIKTKLTLQELASEITKSEITKNSKPDQSHYSYHENKSNKERKAVIKGLSTIPGMQITENNIEEDRKPFLFSFDLLLPKIFGLKKLESMQETIVKKGLGHLISRQIKALKAFIDTMRTKFSKELNIQSTNLFRVVTNDDNETTLFYGNIPETNSCVYQAAINDGSFQNKLLVKFKDDDITARLQGSSEKFIEYKTKKRNPSQGSFKIGSEELNGQTPTQRAAAIMFSQGGENLEVVKDRSHD